MTKLPLASLFLAAAAAAQSPLTTTFTSSTFLAASTGVTVYFDLDVRTAVDVQQIDANFYGAAGPQVRIEVWLRNGTHVGNNSSNAGWTLAGVSNTVTSSGRDVPTPCPFPAPFRLQPGLTGVAVQHFGAGVAYTAGTGVGQIYRSTAEMDFRQGGSANPPIFFVGTQNAPRVMNCSIHYTPLGGFAAATPYGTGCGGSQSYRSYYENFPSQTFDLGGSASTVTTLQHIRTQNGYIVIPGSGAWFTPQSAPLAIAGNTISAAQPLGFAFSLPNGTPSSNVWICDDGYIWLEAAGIADFTPAVNELLTQGARLAPCWMSLDPSGGAIHFDTDPANNAAYVTWLNVPETGNTASRITMQVALFQNGDYEFRYGAETLSTSSNTFALVGMSPGGGVLDPGNRDLSATMPFETGPDLVTPNLVMSTTARPVIGTTMVLDTTNIPAGSPLGAVIFGLVKHDPGIGLGGFGMTGCFQLLSLDAQAVFLPVGGAATQNFTVPNNPAFAGVFVRSQSAVLAPGVNAAGAITSNAIELAIDVF